MTIPAPLPVTVITRAYAIYRVAMADTHVCALLETAGLLADALDHADITVIARRADELDRQLKAFGRTA